MRIVDYHVVTWKDVGIMTAEVRDRIEHGWQPYGDMILSRAGLGDAVFTQPMVKYGEEE